LFHSHSYLFPGVLRTLAGFSLREMNAWVLGCCRFVADPWRPFVKSGRVGVIYNGIAGPERAVHRLPGPPRIGCIGRIAPEKGQSDFLVAATLIHSALPDCEFVIHGAALFSEIGATRYEQELRTSAVGLPVEFAGWAPDVYQALAGLDLLLVPS